jgi:hypothetical protein
MVSGRPFLSILPFGWFSLGALKRMREEFAWLGRNRGAPVGLSTFPESIRMRCPIFSWLVTFLFLPDWRAVILL